MNSLKRIIEFNEFIQFDPWKPSTYNLIFEFTGFIHSIISMRCAPTPPQCPLPSILIAVCVSMSSHCDFYGMCAQHLVAFVGGNYVIFFTRARCECLLPLLHGPPNPCQILLKIVSNGRGGTPWRALSVPKRAKSTQERSTPPRRPKSVSKSIWERS